MRECKPPSLAYICTHTARVSRQARPPPPEGGAQKDLSLRSDKLSFDNWRLALQFAKRCESGVQFWLGDLLRFGYATYGELASQEDGDGLPTQKTLENTKWVAERIPISLRKEDLGFHHHAVVAPKAYARCAWLSSSSATSSRRGAGRFAGRGGARNFCCMQNSESVGW